MEENVTKSSKKPLVVIVLAVFMIGAGVGLILTGNNKSFLGGKEKEDKKDEEVVDEPNKGNVGLGLSNEEAKAILENIKNSTLPEETWTLGEVSVEAKGKDEAYLILYEQISEDGTSTFLETVIIMQDGVGTAELPGWPEGERDLLEYEFVMDDVQDPTEEPTDEVVEPGENTDEQTEPDGNVEGEPTETPEQTEEPSENVDAPVEEQPNTDETANTDIEQPAE